MKHSLKLIVWCTAVLAACNSRTSTAENLNCWVSVRGKDSIVLQLFPYENELYGTYALYRKGELQVQGTVEGKPSGDTLKGTLRYTPRGWKDSKRRAFVLLQRPPYLIEGFGNELTYMGIPFFEHSTISYDSIQHRFAHCVRP